MAASKFSCDRRRDLPLYGWVFALAITLGFYAGNSTAEASIVAPAAPQFSLESSGALCSHQAASQVHEDSASHQESTLFLCHQDASSTSPTSGSSSLAGASATALMHVPSNLLCDPVVAGWVSGERQSLLPSPPNNDLLRPPQLA